MAHLLNLSFNFDVDTNATDKAAVELDRLHSIYPRIVEAFTAETDTSEMFRLDVYGFDNNNLCYVAKPTPQLDHFIAALRCLETKGFKNPAGAEYP